MHLSLRAGGATIPAIVILPRQLVVLFALLLFSFRARAADVRPPAASLGDLWRGNAGWVSDGHALGCGFGFHFQSMIQEEGEIRAYYIKNYRQNGLGKSGVGRARSTDGLTWTDDGILLTTGGDEQHWDDRLSSFPGIWKEAGTYYLTYEGAAVNIPFSPGDVGLATSTDGLHFTKSPDGAILKHDRTGWESTNIGTPSLWKEGETWWLFYHAFNGAKVQIGVATGTSLTNLIKHPKNPLIPVTPGAWDSGTVGKRSAICKEGGYYYMAYEGSTDAPFDKADWSSGMARSKNLIDWEKMPGNPMLPTTKASFGYDGPELIQIKGVWYLYVRVSTPGEAPTKRFRLDRK